MNQVLFDNIKSYDDLYLILNKKEIGSPAVKKKEVAVEGADGVLDMTDYLGRVTFSNRLLKLDFKSLVVPFLEHFSAVGDALHGKKMRIVFEDDPRFFYIGRLNVSAFTNDKNVGNVTIEADCEPYKYKIDETIINRQINGSANINLSNMKKPVVPQITTTASMTIRINNQSFSIGTGTFIIPELELQEGNNAITVSGNGAITFSYQEGRL